VKWHRDAARRGVGAPRPDAPDQGTAEEGVLDCSLEELREFLEADLVDVHADLEFKQTLRQKLWDLVQARNALRGRGVGRR